MCRRIWSSKTSALARIPSTFAAMAEHTYIPKYFMRHVCAPKFYRTPWCCKLHASHRSRRKHPQRYNEPNSLVTSTTSCTNLLHTRTIQYKECVLRSLRPRLLRLTKKHHCRIDMQTEQWSSLWSSQFPHRLSHQTNQAPHVLARIH